MEKYRRGLSRPKEENEPKRHDHRITTLQLRRLGEENIDEDDNGPNNTLSTPNLLKPEYLRKPKPTMLSNIQNLIDKKEESKKEENEKTDNPHIKHPFGHIVSPAADKDNFKKFISMLYRGTIYSIKFLKGPSEKYLNSKMVNLPEPKVYKKKFLVLDLDETLIHTVQPKEKCDVILKLDDNDSLCFNVRPYCLEFLERMNEHFAIYIFTASTPAYATPIIQYLNKKNKTILGILSRPHCMETRNGFYIKDLRIIKNRSLKDIIMVDNLVHSFGLQIDNGIPILEYTNDPKDTELRFLESTLMALKDEEDVRPWLDKKLGLKKIPNMNERDLGLVS